MDTAGEVNSATLGREGLGFPQAVTRSFAFLEGYGYKLTTLLPTFVRFESRGGFINVFHGRRSYEVGLEFGRLTRGSFEMPAYYMGELLNLFQPAIAKDYMQYASRSADGVATGVAQLAGLLRLCVESGAFEDGALFERLAGQRAQFFRDDAIRQDLKRARLALLKVWRERLYADVVALLAPLRGELEPSELKKLEYAEKKITGK